MIETVHRDAVPIETLLAHHAGVRDLARALVTLAAGEEREIELRATE